MQDPSRMSAGLNEEDDPPPYSSSGVGPPTWQPRFEDLSSASTASHRGPLDPPPQCFSTPSPLRVKSHDFPPFRIQSVSENLTDGFPVLYPCDLLEKHGIGKSDWVRFLEDLGIAARLASEGFSAIGSRAPVTTLHSRGIFTSPTSGAVYDSLFTKSPLDEVHALIDVWNQSAFERRKLRVLLQMKSESSTKAGYELVVESL
ncbi:hypothetical protein F5I97DRAFT_466808 [Phlebopus sp. FC_14]|nr:hypothetical protein F5I97DRAFT_466808 [Phlebopus sp. FC_14]